MNIHMKGSSHVTCETNHIRSGHTGKEGREEKGEERSGKESNTKRWVVPVYRTEIWEDGIVLSIQKCN